MNVDSLAAVIRIVRTGEPWCLPGRHGSPSKEISGQIEMQEPNTNLMYYSREFLDFIEEANVTVLLLLAVVAHHITRSLLEGTPWQSAAKYVVAPPGLILLLYLLRNEPFEDDPALTAMILIRWSLICWLTCNTFARPCVFLTNLFIRYAQKEWARLVKFSRDLDSWHHSAKPGPSTKSDRAAEPESRETAITRQSNRAKKDYEFEIKVIEAAKLEEEEREAAIS